jgi:hypothetical protein
MKWVNLLSVYLRRRIGIIGLMDKSYHVINQEMTWYVFIEKDFNRL